MKKNIYFQNSYDFCNQKEIHKRIMKRLQNMSDDDIFESCVEIGIYTKNGNLKKEYK